VLKSTYHGLTQTDLVQLAVNKVHVVGSRCGPFAPALLLLAQSWIDIETLIQARYPLDQGQLALQRAAERGTLKVLLEM
jgi:threonine dehydrogenase-like Zn-dependent dehydrogenase